MRFRLWKDKLVQYGSAFLLITKILVVVLIAVGLTLKSLPLLKNENLWEILSSSVWSPLRGNFGFLPFILGTVWVTVISLIIAVPLCIMASIYLVEFASDRLRKSVLPLMNVLAAIPPVLYGVWGILFVVPILRNYVAPLFGVDTTGFSVFAGGIVLAVMIFPILISIMVEVMQTVPQELKDASLSLGATQWETIVSVNLRKAKPGIIAAVVLGVSRAIGETIAVLMVCGNVPQIPKSWFDAGYPIPALIANNFGEMMSIPMYDSALMFAALLLFVIIFGFNLISRLVLNRLEDHG
ncbi:phosphate ABC transporter permease subunit PstC [Sphingobacterium sp. lm-10]|uniref:phosphate ABC transporter permease subunit PstC n=1 Tax=Sphingobacterium sp. lm-10 TaxID=2944904 RepID=UPI002022953F|nr:phosphate ABC transporter permease subunit PstC [Sphingobacterium sp. lm-10]MCL7986915.1 phosphate ABC transporter permease subunit PstC [Sphingobacterium sp. lm-10]